MTFKNILSTTTLNKNDILSETFSTSKTIAFSEASFFFLQNKQLSTRCSFHKCYILVSIWWIELTSYKWLRDRSYTITLSTVYKTHNHNMTKTGVFQIKTFPTTAKKVGKKYAINMYAYCTIYLLLGYEKRKRRKYTLVAASTKTSRFLYKYRRKIIDIIFIVKKIYLCKSSKMKKKSIFGELPVTTWS